MDKRTSRHLCRYGALTHDRASKPVNRFFSRIGNGLPSFAESKKSTELILCPQSGQSLILIKDVNI